MRCPCVITGMTMPRSGGCTAVNKGLVTGLSRHHRGADPEDTHNSENTERDPPLTLCLLGCTGVRSSVCFATMPRSGITHFERDQLFILTTH